MKPTSLTISTTLTDKELLESAKQGNEGAFAVLYEKYAKTLYRYVWRVTNQPSLAEDIVHDAFINCMIYGAPIQNADFLMFPYLCTTARHAASKYFVKRSSEIEIEEVNEADLPINAHQLLPVSCLTQIEQQDLIEKILSVLPVLQREVVVLFDMEGCSLAETAEITGTNIGTVKSRLKRARENMKKQLQILQITDSVVN